MNYVKIKTLLLTVLTYFSMASHAGEPAPLDPVLTTIQSGFSNAIALRHAGDGSGRLFIVEQGGLIKIIDNGATLPAPFINLSSAVSGGFEQGLLGLAFHPNYVVNGYFYVHYTDTDGDTVVSRFSVSNNDPNLANDQNELIIIRIDQDFANHNGGDIHFSPADGYLYISLGDGGSGNDPCNRGQTKDPNNIQNTGSGCAADNNFEGNDNSRALLGTMLRIDVDSPGVNVADACGEGVNYGIPADNPFSDDAQGNNDCGEIWAWGLRNPYRFGFDRDTGDLFIGDVGQNAREEINFQPGTSTGGENYGWVCREGFIQTPGQTCSIQSAVDPIIDYPTGSGRCSAIGGFPYRGIENTWQGTYIYADYCTGELFWAVQENGTWLQNFQILTDTPNNIGGFGEDESGNLYYLNFGSVIQITDANYDDVIFDNGFEQ